MPSSHSYTATWPAGLGGDWRGSGGGGGVRAMGGAGQGGGGRGGGKRRLLFNRNLPGSRLCKGHRDQAVLGLNHLYHVQNEPSVFPTPTNLNHMSMWEATGMGLTGL